MKKKDFGDILGGSIKEIWLDIWILSTITYTYIFKMSSERVANNKWFFEGYENRLFCSSRETCLFEGLIFISNRLVSSKTDSVIWAYVHLSCLTFKTHSSNELAHVSNILVSRDEKQTHDNDASVPGLLY